MPLDVFFVNYFNTAFLFYLKMTLPPICCKLQRSAAQQQGEDDRIRGASRADHIDIRDWSVYGAATLRWALAWLDTHAPDPELQQLFRATQMHSATNTYYVRLRASSMAVLFGTPSHSVVDPEPRFGKV